MAVRQLICASEALVDGGPGVRFEVDEDGEPAPALAVRYRGRVHAYVNRCAHLGLELDILPGDFFDLSGDHLICATHGATYDPATGRCTGGPCSGGGLEALTVVEVDGRVELVDRRLAGAPETHRATGLPG